MEPRRPKSAHRGRPKRKQKPRPASADRARERRSATKKAELLRLYNNVPQYQDPLQNYIWEMSDEHSAMDREIYEFRQRQNNELLQKLTEERQREAEREKILRQVL